jgi:multiple sugar transport system ATP-binding protein
MAFGLTLRHLPRDEIRRRVTEAATILGIEKLLDRKPRQLSGGQRQRVALGRAIVREPQVFLLDEPLSNLDAKLRVQTRAEISKLHRRLGTTFVYVTHDQTEAMTMATRIAVLDQGELQQVGTPIELYERPRNVFVASFIGSPGINLVDADVTTSNERLTLHFDGITLAVPASYAAAYAPYAGKEVIFGIRPEHVHERRPDSDPDEAEINATVEVTELLGDETLVHLNVAGKTFLARFDARAAARPGDTVTLALDMDRMYAFDPETQLEIPRTA